MALCGILPPTHEAREQFAEQMRGASPCLRCVEHEGEHLFQKRDGTYIAWQDDCTHEGQIPQDVHELEWIYAAWKVCEEEAELIFNSEKPVV